MGYRKEKAVFKGKLRKAKFAVIALINPATGWGDRQRVVLWEGTSGCLTISLKAFWVEPWLQPQNTARKERS